MSIYNIAHLRTRVNRYNTPPTTPYTQKQPQASAPVTTCHSIPQPAPAAMQQRSSNATSNTSTNTKSPINIIPTQYHRYSASVKQPRQVAETGEGSDFFGVKFFRVRYPPRAGRWQQATWGGGAKSHKCSSTLHQGTAGSSGNGNGCGNGSSDRSAAAAGRNSGYTYKWL